MIVGKIHRKGGEAIFAACDKELVGKALTSPEGHEIKISSSFFGDEEMSRDDFVTFLNQATSANLFGKTTIECAIDAGFIENDAIVQIGDVPYAQLFMF